MLLLICIINTNSIKHIFSTTSKLDASLESICPNQLILIHVDQYKEFLDVLVSLVSFRHKDTSGGQGMKCSQQLVSFRHNDTSGGQGMKCKSAVG